jgi:hypothetical protein
MDLSEVRETRDDIAQWGEQWLLVADYVGMAVGAAVAFTAVLILLS